MILIHLNSHEGHIIEVFSDNLDEPVVVVDVDDESEDVVILSTMRSEIFTKTPLELVKQFHKEALYYIPEENREPSEDNILAWKIQMFPFDDHLTPTVEEIDNDDYPSSPTPTVGAWGIFSYYPSGDDKEHLLEFFAFYQDAREVFLSDYVGEKEWVGNRFDLDLEINHYYILRLITDEDLCV
jgi:hypothetical protein